MKRAGLLLAAVAFAACDRATSPMSPKSLNGPPAFAAGGSSGPSANGQGSLTIAGERRSFSFNAVMQKDNTVSGHAELHNRAADARIHVDIQCLFIYGNIAAMSGLVTQANIEGADATAAVFRVQDNGEGSSNDADQVSLLQAGFPPELGPVLCNGGALFLPLMPIQDGNIQVKP